jgi:hypothetical protein
MSPEEEKQLKTALGNILKAQHDALMTALTCSEHVFASEAALFGLDARARQLSEASSRQFHLLPRTPV